MGPKKHSLLRLARTIETEPEVLKIQVNEIAIIFYISFHEKKTSTDLSSNPSIAGGSLSLVFRGRTKTFIRGFGSVADPTSLPVLHGPRISGHTG